MESSNRLMTYDEEKKACEFIDELPESALEHSERFTELTEERDNALLQAQEMDSYFENCVDEMTDFLDVLQGELESDLRPKKLLPSYKEKIQDHIDGITRTLEAARNL